MNRIYHLKNADTSAAVEPRPHRNAPIDFTAELNAQQLAAVTSPPGQALVIAGAGSGKTRTLTYRVAYLLQNAVAAENILLLTFTNKASREMLERVESLLPGQTAGLWGGTFHSICAKILRRHAEMLGLTRSFSILDSDDQKSLLTKICKELDIAEKVENATGEKFPKAPVILGLLSLTANTMENPEELIRREFSEDDDMVAGILKVAEAYKKRKHDANSLDFDDLLAFTLRLFGAHEDVLREYQSQFQFVLVDEYQDTNALQGELIDLLSGKHGNIMVVGDDAQSIYSWRGANFRYILEFPQRHPGAKIYKIETNYRSVPEVLNLANEAIRGNVNQFEKQLQPVRPKLGRKPALIPLRTTQEQASFVCQRIQELHEEGMAYSEMAVLYRAHFQSMDVQLAMTQARIPFVITSGLKFFEQAHIKDFSAFLKFAANPRDESAFDRLVRMVSGVGAASAAKLWNAWTKEEPAQSGRPPAKFSKLMLAFKVPTRAKSDWEQLAYTLDELVDDDGNLLPPGPVMMSIKEGIYDDYLKANFDNHESRKQDIEQFMNYAAEFETVESMLSELSLLAGPEQAVAREQEDRESVTLSSVHQAKGLEWKAVFIIWLTNSMFPNLRAVEEGGMEALEEERRLFYVAVTRSMDELYLTFPMFWQKAWGDGDSYQEPSQFLTDLPKKVYEEWSIGRPY